MYFNVFGQRVSRARYPACTAVHDETLPVLGQA
jgi:hypothetical protein